MKGVAVNAEVGVVAVLGEPLAQELIEQGGIRGTEGTLEGASRQGLRAGVITRLLASLVLRV
jgi:hypothetical protein